ncbi:putative maleylacetoacetate isomerase protein [Phaeoacremonium minimum UCRPA7]|uniref:Putative maleylacetoacetate isomerase protein n=1 Tax=Phaeoacremonium minimum (strain UCR-PA7) TaxID=1286976 RepID=R8BK96_PHAM7|nr:putative maleylacetoacetate isomerase protein [Phaeoacremonium minimum UCRPA7]EON99709.1 putative maleylacetoacetate isomerase protein [Phaeoacremonium minimum UCRPA7]
MLSRARIRSLVQIIVGDVQPITNTKVQKFIRGFGYDSAKWTAEWYAVGLRAYESVIHDIARKYSVGDDVTMADACLAPAIWNCEAVGLSLDEFPTVKKVYAELMQLEAFQNSHWKAQVDCPEDLK